MYQQYWKRGTSVSTKKEYASFNSIVVQIAKYLGRLAKTLLINQVIRKLDHILRALSDFFYLIPPPPKKKKEKKQKKSLKLAHKQNTHNKCNLAKCTLEGDLEVEVD